MKLFSKSNAMWLALICATYILLEVAVMTGLLNSFYEITLMNIFINIILAVGLNLIVGYSGQLSLGHAGFMAIGAYATGILTRQQPSMTMFVISIFVGVLLTGVVAFLVGMPTLRLQGDYLAIATLGVAEIIRIVILNLEDLTNGAAGLSGIPFLANWRIAFIMTIIAMIVVVNFTHGSMGRAIISVREDEVAAKSLGINTFTYKMIAFVLGAMTASMAGSLHASYFSVINPGQFTLDRSVDILIIVVFGGIGSMTGSVVAAVILAILNTYLQQFGALRMIIYALILILIMLFKPSGLLGGRELSFARLFNQKAVAKEEESDVSA